MNIMSITHRHHIIHSIVVVFVLMIHLIIVAVVIIVHEVLSLCVLHSFGLRFACSASTHDLVTRAASRESHSQLRTASHDAIQTSDFSLSRTSLPSVAR